MDDYWQKRKSLILQKKLGLNVSSMRSDFIKLTIVGNVETSKLVSFMKSNDFTEKTSGGIYSVYI